METNTDTANTIPVSVSIFFIVCFLTPIGFFWLHVVLLDAIPYIQTAISTDGSSYSNIF